MTSFDGPQPTSLRLDVAVGNVRVNADDRDDTFVEVLPSDPANDHDVTASEQTLVEFTDGQLVVRGRKRGGLLRSLLRRSWGGSIDVEIGAPAGSHLRADLGFGDIRCDGRLGDCRIRTGLGQLHLEESATLELDSGVGDVTVGRVTSRAKITTASGDVRLGELGADADVENSNGDTHVGIACGELRVRAANGDITVDLALADVDARSSNGDVRLGEVVRGSVVLATQLGDVEVGIGEGARAQLDVHAETGTVINTLDSTATPDASPEPVRLRARAAVGRITIQRPPGTNGQ